MMRHLNAKYHFIKCEKKKTNELVISQVITTELVIKLLKRRKKTSRDNV